MTNKKLFKYPNVASLKAKVNTLQDALDLVGVSFEEAQANQKNNTPNAWRIDCGCFLEYRDASGLEAAHPSFGISSFYFTKDNKIVEVQTTPKGNFNSVGNQPSCENWFKADERDVFRWNGTRYSKKDLLEQLKQEGFEFEEVMFDKKVAEPTVVCIPTPSSMMEHYPTEEAFLKAVGLTREEAKENQQNHNGWYLNGESRYTFRVNGSEATDTRVGFSDIFFNTYSNRNFKFVYNTPRGVLGGFSEHTSFLIEPNGTEQYYDGKKNVSRENYVEAVRKAHEKSGPVVFVERFEPKKEDVKLETKQEPKTINVTFWKDVPSDFTGIAIQTLDGDTLRFLNGERHREDGPAYEAKSGAKAWWLNGKRHRVDGPAREWPDGRKEWWLNGFLHREDGPAIVYGNGDKDWWLNGKPYSESNWKKEVAKLSLKEKKLIEINVFENPEASIKTLFKTFADTAKVLGISRDEVLANHARKDRSECWGLEERHGILTWYNKNGKEEIHPEYGISFLTFDLLGSEDSDNKLMVFGVSDYTGETNHKGTYSVEFEADGVNVFTRTKSHSAFLKETAELGEYKVNTKKGVIRRFAKPSVDVPKLFGTLEAVLKYLGLSEETALKNHSDRVPGSWRLEESSNDYCNLSWFGADGLAEPSQEFGINFFNFHDGDLRSFGVCDQEETIRSQETFMYDIVGDQFKIHKYRNGNNSYENWVTLMSKQYCVAPFVEPIVKAAEEEEEDVEEENLDVKLNDSYEEDDYEENEEIDEEIDEEIEEEIEEDEQEDITEVEVMVKKEVNLLDDPLSQIPPMFSSLEIARKHLGNGWKFKDNGIGETLVVWESANGEETINPDIGLSFFIFDGDELGSFGVASKEGELSGPDCFQCRWHAPSEEFLFEDGFGLPSYSAWLARAKTWADYSVKSVLTGSLMKVAVPVVAAATMAEKVKTVAISDAKQVAVRISVEQVARVVQTLVCELLTSQTKGAKKASLVVKLNEFFSTEKGKAFIKFFVGCSAPMLKDHLPEKYHSVLETVASEARIQGEVTAIMSVASMMEPVVSILGSNMYASLFGGTNSEQVRVNVNTTTHTNNTEELASESVSSAVAFQVAK
jgi:hypothetical protein